MTMSFSYSRRSRRPRPACRSPAITDTTTPFNNPIGITVDSDGHIYVTDAIQVGGAAGPLVRHPGRRVVLVQHHSPHASANLNIFPNTRAHVWGVTLGLRRKHLRRSGCGKCNSRLLVAELSPLTRPARCCTRSETAATHCMHLVT